MGNIFTKKIVVTSGLVFCSICHTLLAQGLFPKSKAENKLIEPPTLKVDPARFFKLQLVEFKAGYLNSDDWLFQRMLKNNGFMPGQSNFYDFGLKYTMVIQKFTYGANAELTTQNSEKIPSLGHKLLQAELGYILIRNRNNLFSISTKFGLQSSKIKFGDNKPPAFLTFMNFSHGSSKLYQQQFILGAAANFNKLFLNQKKDGGLTLGIEAGINFAPFKSHWKYGYDYANSSQINTNNNEMLQTSKETFNITLKLGLWDAI